MECGNYRGIKLLEIGLKVYERVIERRIRQQVTNASFLFLTANCTSLKRYWTFVDLEKAFDRVPREVI